MTVENNYDDTSHRSIGEGELRRFNTIVENHSEQLAEIIEALQRHPLLSWKNTISIVQPKLSSNDDAPVTKLVYSDNKMVTKVVVTLAAVVMEMRQLSEEARTSFFNPLLLYGEPENNYSESTGEIQLCLSRILPILQRVNFFINRVKKVTLHVLRQLSAFYSTEKNSRVLHTEEVHLQVVFEALGEMLHCLVVLDEIISCNSLLHDHWGAYRRLVKSSISTADEENKKQYKLLERLLNDLEATVMQGNTFKWVLTSCRDSPEMRSGPPSNVSSRMLAVMIGWCSQLEQSQCDGWWSECQTEVVSLTCLVVLHYHLYHSLEKKLVKQVLAVYKKVPCVTLFGPVVWFGERFIPKYVPTYECVIDKKTQDNLLTFRSNYLAQKVASLAKDTQSYNLQICGWCVQLDNAGKTPPSQLNNHDLIQRASLLLQGQLVANTIKYTLRSVLNLHTALGQPMGKACVVQLGLVVELLKTVRRTYEHHSLLVAESLPRVAQFLSYQILNAIGNVKKRMYSDRHLDEKKLDIISALTVAEQALSGPGTPKRRLLGRIALSYANQGRTFLDEELANLQVLLRRFDLALEVQSRLRLTTDCSLLYHHRVIIPSFIERFSHSSADLHNANMLLSAASDCANDLKAVKHVSCGEIFDKYQEEIKEHFNSLILDKLCKEIEVELRLSTHLHLKLDDRNPFNKPISRNITSYININNISMFDVSLSVKEYIEQYLERTFYSLTVVAPHDCHSYDQMRNVATQKYHLQPIPSHLPSHTLDQTVDVLEIMRNIDVFVQHYVYNLNQQFFVERSSKNKHLNTISIHHIANSIRTHGAGIINTTVNYTYQFLRKKFHIFSQFLYDEHIKSRLLKDLQHWKKVKGTQNKFPYDRALKFHRGIRKLGLNSEGLSYLDQFRKLITQIGNAMGYVRLVRSSGLDCSSTATLFIPDLEDLINFGEVCDTLDVSPETKMAAANLDAVITNLTDNFQQGTDYFKMMVDVFAPALKNQKNSHLKNFYLIIPALTINFVEHALAGKDGIHKRNKSQAVFTDDGLAMGIAYLLKVLDQNEAFASLHWWSTVRKKFIQEKEKITKEDAAGSAADDKLGQTMALTISRLKLEQQEFELLYLSISSAQTFFKRSNRLPDES